MKVAVFGVLAAVIVALVPHQALAAYPPGCTEYVYTPQYKDSNKVLVDWRYLDSNSCYAPITITCSTTITFKWSSPSYYYDVKQLGSDDCNAYVTRDYSGAASKAGYVDISFQQAGEYYFAATTPGQCATGHMKIKIIVTGTCPSGPSGGEPKPFPSPSPYYPTPECKNQVYPTYKPDGSVVVDWKYLDPYSCHAPIKVNCSTKISFVWSNSMYAYDLKQVGSDACNAPALQDYSTAVKDGSVDVSFLQAGEYYFLSSGDGQCATGHMKIKIIVTTTCPTGEPKPVPSPSPYYPMPECKSEVYPTYQPDGSAVIDWKYLDSYSCYAPVKVNCSTKISFIWSNKQYGYDLKQVGADACNAPVVRDYGGPSNYGYLDVSFLQAGEYYLISSGAGQCGNGHMKIKIIVTTTCPTGGNPEEPDEDDKCEDALKLTRVVPLKWSKDDYDQTYTLYKAVSWAPYDCPFQQRDAYNYCAMKKKVLAPYNNKNCLVGIKRLNLHKSAMVSGPAPEDHFPIITPSGRIKMIETETISVPYFVCVYNPVKPEDEDD